MRSIAVRQKKILSRLSDDNVVSLSLVLEAYRANNVSVAAIAVNKTLNSLSELMQDNNLSVRQQVVIVEFLLSMPTMQFNLDDMSDPYHFEKQLLIKYAVYFPTAQSFEYKLSCFAKKYLISKNFELYLRAGLLLLRGELQQTINNQSELIDCHIKSSIGVKDYMQIPVKAWYPDAMKDNGKTIIYVHGLHHSKEHASRFAEEMSHTGFKVISYDQVGHGKRTEDYSKINNFRLKQELIALCEYYSTIEQRDLIVVGHSLGASIALQVCDDLDCVKHTVAISPAMEPTKSILKSLFNSIVLLRVFKKGAYIESKHYIREDGLDHKRQGLKFAWFNLGNILKKSYDSVIKNTKSNAHIILGSKDKVVANYSKSISKLNYSLDTLSVDHLSPIGVPSSIAQLIHQKLP